MDSTSSPAAPSSWILEIRRRLSEPPASRLPPREARQASVLVPLFVDAGELWTLLTKRTDHLPHHKSQIAFPGGGRELGEDAWGAALREAQEEVGFEPTTVLRLGELDEAETPSGFRIVPCVGAVPCPFEPRLNEGEIAEAFRVPLSAFTNPRLIEDQEVRINGKDRILRVYHVGSHRVWGLTARILQNLMARMGLDPAVAEL
jgi:8-oxo-dGTP pyrophosphatase MutT (NUDIX family)